MTTVCWLFLLVLMMAESGGGSGKLPSAVGIADKIICTHFCQ